MGFQHCPITTQQIALVLIKTSETQTTTQAAARGLSRMICWQFLPQATSPNAAPAVTGS